MKTLNSCKISLALLAALCTMVSSCSKSFSNRPPVDAIAIDNFYQSDAQVQAATTVLYSAPWFGYQTKVGWSITELYGGNGRTYSGDVINFGNFSVTNLNFEIQAAWDALYTEVAQANALITTLPVKKSAAVDSATFLNAMGEAHFWRAMAYFHLYGADLRTRSDHRGL